MSERHHTHTHMHIQKMPSEDLEGGHLQAKGRGLRKNQTCQHFDLEFPSSRTMRKTHFCSVRYPVFRILLWQPEQTRIRMENSIHDS